ncbi:MAG: DUF2029 domain-containing protein [Anaerolineae bacterium]|nr:MAG: DUF2029 domain-containing protein [Anaerolineae bacterium]
MNRLPRTRFQDALYLLLALVSLALIGALGWMNYRFAMQSPGGNDFLVHWEGTRALLFDGISPYSDEVALRIQQRAYGRPAQAGEHELRVAYPLYSALVFAPFALIGEYTLARAVWMTALELALILLAVLCIRLTRWRPVPWLLGVYLLFALTWYHAVRPLINGNAVVWIALFLTGAVLALRTGQQEAAGLLLSLATIKPHLALLPVLFMLLWAAGHRRWRFVIWFFGTLIFLVALGMLFLPDWPLQNLREILRYTSYNPPTTMQAALQEWLPGVGRQLGWILSGSLGILLLVEWARDWKKPFRYFLWTFCLTLVIGQWIGITTDPGNFILLFLPLTLVLAEFERRYGRSARWWSLVSMLILLVGLWWIFLATLTQVNGQPQQSTVMFLPLPLYLFWGLYWVRWWAVREAVQPLVDGFFA